jgi:histone acetyltransferase (RNA polymerase elongator complex component)
VRDLEGRLDRQTLLLRALFSLLVDKAAMTEKELLRRVLELAPPGGVYARPVQTPPHPCPKCGRTFGYKRNHCMFCGDEREVSSAFDLL